MQRVNQRWSPRAMHVEMAIRQTLGQGPGLSAFLSKLSIAGMVIAVSFLLASLSVMNGFEREMRLTILNLVPHITVGSYATNADPMEVQSKLEDLQGIVRSHSFDEENVLFSAKSGSRVGGLIFSGARAIQPLAKHLKPSVERLEPKEIILGHKLAEALEVSVGERVVALISEDTGVRRFQPVSMILAATLDSGTEIDNIFAVADLATRDDHSNSRPGAWAVTLEDPLDAPRVGQTLRRVLGPQYWVSDWTRSLGNLYQAIQLSRQIVGLMLVALLVVAVFNVVTSLVLVTSDRRPSSAMLRAMGASPVDVFAIFTLQGTIIGAGGAIMGAVLGAVLALMIPHFVSLIEAFSGQPLLDTSVYPLAYVPVDLRWSDFTTVSAAAFCLSLLACAIPAISSSRHSITESLRESR